MISASMPTLFVKKDSSGSKQPEPYLISHWNSSSFSEHPKSHVHARPVRADAEDDQIREKCLLFTLQEQRHADPYQW